MFAALYFKLHGVPGWICILLVVLQQYDCVGRVSAASKTVQLTWLFVYYILAYCSPAICVEKCFEKRMTLVILW